MSRARSTCRQAATSILAARSRNPCAGRTLPHCAKWRPDASRPATLPHLIRSRLDLRWDTVGRCAVRRSLTRLVPPNRVIYPLAAAFPVGVLSAITRVAAAFPTVWTMPLLVVSACLDHRFRARLRTNAAATTSRPVRSHRIAQSQSLGVWISTDSELPNPFVLRHELLNLWLFWMEQDHGIRETWSNRP